MQTVGQLIRARRLELGLTLQAIADMAQCTKSYLSTIENDRREHPPSREMLERIERALRMESGRLVSVGMWQSTPRDVRRQVLDFQTRDHLTQRMVDLMKREGLDKVFRSGELKHLVDRLSPDSAGESSPSGGAGGSARRSQSGDSASGSADGRSLHELGALPMQVPVINKVAAGYPREFTDLAYPARIADEYVAVPDVFDADAFAARVVGDSMMPDYREGDIVVFSPAAPVNPGDDCFVRFERDEETTFKRVYFEKEANGGELIRLQPLNSAYPPKTYPREDVAGMYAAVYVVRAVPRGGKGGKGKK